MDQTAFAEAQKDPSSQDLPENRQRFVDNTLDYTMNIIKTTTYFIRNISTIDSFLNLPITDFVLKLLTKTRD